MKQSKKLGRPAGPPWKRDNVRVLTDVFQFVTEQLERTDVKFKSRAHVYNVAIQTIKDKKIKLKP